MLGWAIKIQSMRSPEYLEHRVEAFLVELRTIIESLEPEEWEGRKQSLVDKRREKVKNLREENGRIWGAIREGSFDFQRRK